MKTQNTKHKTQNTKHKTLIVLLSFFLSFSSAFAQNHIALSPLEGQGYMVLDNQSQDNIHSWKISIIERTHNNQGTYDERVIEKTALPSGTNYCYIPTKYRKMDYPTYYLVTVEGLDANKNIVASQPNVHLNKGNSVNEDLIPTESGVIPYALTQCRKTCIGRGYAYTIQQYKQIYANLSMFIVEPAFKAFDENSNTFNPYFYYTFQSSGNQHEVGPFMSGPNENVTVFNINGYPMVGQVYGQPKTLGLWAGSPELATPGSYAIGTEFCNETLYPLSTAITWINTTGYPPNDTRPPLQCVPGPGAYSGGGGVPPGPSDPTAPTDFDDYVTFTFCYENGVLVPCPPSPSPTSNPVLSPNALEPDSVAFIQIKDLNNPANSPIMIDVPSLYNDDGSFNGYNLNLAPSLYSFGFMFKHNGYWAKIGEFQNTTNLSLTQADMVNISVYPTPITNNRFEIETVGNATVQFVYELHDFSGELILNKDMSIRKDHEKVTSIEADNIPEGLLLHKFIFEDGSTQTIQTIKN